MIFKTDIKYKDIFSLISGETQVLEEIQAIDQSIGLIVSTAKGELFGDPDFGCNLYTYLYKYDGPALYQMIRRDIATNLNKQETRIFVREEDIEIDSLPNEKTLEIKIKYNIRYTQYISQYTYLLRRNKEDIA